MNTQVPLDAVIKVVDNNPERAIDIEDFALLYEQEAKIVSVGPHRS